MDPQSAMSLVTTVGFPIALLLMIVYGVYKVGAWLAPMIKVAFDKHFALIDETVMMVKTVPQIVAAGSCRVHDDVLVSHVDTTKKLSDVIAKQLELNTSTMAKMILDMDGIREAKTATLSAIQDVKRLLETKQA